MEVPFFHSQLTKVGTKAGIGIGLVDKVETKRQTKALVRAGKKEAAAVKKQEKQKTAKALEDDKCSDFENNFKEDESTTVDEDEEFRSAATDRLVKNTRQNRLKLAEVKTFPASS